MATRNALWLALAALLWTAGCTEDLTQVVVVVDTNLAIPDQIDSIALEVDAREIGGDVSKRDGSLGAGGSNLPITLGLLHESGPLGPVRVLARGLHADDVVLEREALFHFQKGRILMLRLDLMADCLGVDCDAGMTCVNGSCRSGEVAPNELQRWPGGVDRLEFNCTDEVCNGRDDDCDGVVDNGFSLETDPLNCGECGYACAAPYVDAAKCQLGECVIGACAERHFDCDDAFLSGCEEPGTNPNHCGGCGLVCELPGAAESCISGRCTIRSCEEGRDNCDGRNENGCEIDLATDLFNCGGCDRGCQGLFDYDRASPGCVDFECTMVCDPAFDDCDGDVTNGCEQDLSNFMNCGACGLICVEPDYLCSGDESSGYGCIAPPCPDGTEQCDNTCADLTSHVSHCGRCGRACEQPPHASAECVDSDCTFRCDNEYGDCDGDGSNGCETPLNQDEYCGACDNSCDVAGGESCVEGECFDAPCPDHDPTCGGVVDAGLPDGGDTDSGAFDAGPDGGDSGFDAIVDGGVDGAPVDGGPADGGPGLDAEADAGGGCPDHSPVWWDVDYEWRHWLTIEESIDGVLDAGYSVVFRLDTRALVDAGDMLENGDDLRVLQFGASGLVELDRHLIAMNTADTEVWFKTQYEISRSDDTYFIYYGNPGATNPPDYWADSMGVAVEASRVYLAADDFEDEDLGARPDGWEGSPNYAVARESSSNQVLEVNGPNTRGDYLFSGDYAWTDVAVRVRQRAISYAANVYYGLFTRAEADRNFDTLWYGALNESTLEAYGLRLSRANTTALSGATHFESFSGHSVGTAWRDLEVRLEERQAEFYFEGRSIGSYTLPLTKMTAGRVGFCAGYSTTRARWDDLTVRRYVNPEPTVSGGEAEAYCP
jgi:hypothetical protein